MYDYYKPLALFKVGFVATLAVDNGNTIVSRGGRIRPEYRQRGFYKKLLENALRATKGRVHAFAKGNIGNGMWESLQREHRLVLLLVS